MRDYQKALHRVTGSFPIVEFSALTYLTDAQGNLLLIQDPEAGYWKLPGGMIHPGERVIECLRRTVFHQIGVTIEKAVFLNLFSGKEQNYIAEDSARITPVYAACLPTQTRGVLRNNEESRTEIRFFATWNVPLASVFPPMTETIQFFLDNFPGGVPLRPFDIDRFSEES